MMLMPRKRYEIMAPLSSFSLLLAAPWLRVALSRSASSLRHHTFLFHTFLTLFDVFILSSSDRKIPRIHVSR